MRASSASSLLRKSSIILRYAAEARSCANPCGALPTMAPGFLALGIRLKRPILPKRYIHSLRFFLDGISPRKDPTTFFLEGTAVEALDAYCERGIPESLTQPFCLLWTIIRGYVSSTGVCERPWSVSDVVGRCGEVALG